jgi:ABC-type nitrate/sulfonate/bicarbonate transport system substrate-binding protein
MDDFSIVSGGTSNVRYAALASGNVQAAILTQPFDLIAEAAGMRILATAHDAMKDWTFASIAVNQGWAATNRPAIVKLLRALRKAIRYGYGHKEQSVALLVGLTHADPDIVRRAYDLDFTRWHAFDDGFHLSDGSVRYIDPSYAAEAVR